MQTDTELEMFRILQVTLQFLKMKYIFEFLTYLIFLLNKKNFSLIQIQGSSLNKIVKIIFVSNEK